MCLCVCVGHFLLVHWDHTMRTRSFETWEALVYRLYIYIYSERLEMCAPCRRPCLSMTRGMFWHCVSVVGTFGVSCMPFHSMRRSNYLNFVLAVTVCRFVDSQTWFLSSPAMAQTRTSTHLSSRSIDRTLDTGFLSTNLSIRWYVWHEIDRYVAICVDCPRPIHVLIIYCYRNMQVVKN